MISNNFKVKVSTLNHSLRLKCVSIEFLPVPRRRAAAWPERYLLARSTREGGKGGQIWLYLVVVPTSFWQTSDCFHKFQRTSRDFDMIQTFEFTHSTSFRDVFSIKTIISIVQGFGSMCRFPGHCVWSKTQKPKEIKICRSLSTNYGRFGSSCHSFLAGP